MKKQAEDRVAKDILKVIDLNYAIAQRHRSSISSLQSDCSELDLIKQVLKSLQNENRELRLQKENVVERIMGLLDENEKLREGRELQQYQGVLEENAALKEQLVQAQEAAQDG